MEYNTLLGVKGDSFPPQAAAAYCHRYGIGRDDVNYIDVEPVILTGEIIERQKDQDTGEWQYPVAGNTLADEPSIVVAKLAFTGKLTIIIVYRLE
jgi:hypothetical protein